MGTGYARQPVWTVLETRNPPSPAGTRTPDRPAQSKSLFQLEEILLEKLIIPYRLEEFLVICGIRRTIILNMVTNVKISNE